LLHGGAHKINNTLGQALLAKKMKKKRIIAETGAGQHGVATAMACSCLGLPSEVYMGYKDTLRQQQNVFRMDLLGCKKYPILEKKYSKFDVIIDAGQVRKGEVLGILGANALGKTTMMKMIAGVEKPDSGSVNKKLKIAYKPQYLSSDIDVDVVSVLNKANEGLIEGSQEEEQIVDPLKIKKLYNKSIKNLSGGELQKVSIVTCLLQKADLYALDEPSAFLDVEDRIAIAKFIQQFTRSYGKSAMVIDHDVQLLDLVSDSMVIFEGISGVNGHATSPLSKVEGMNKFLKSLDVTFRRDEKSRRPRVNKEKSRLDKIQKAESNFYY